MDLSLGAEAAPPLADGAGRHRQLPAILIALIQLAHHNFEGRRPSTRSLPVIIFNRAAPTTTGAWRHLQ